MILWALVLVPVLAALVLGLAGSRANAIAGTAASTLAGLALAGAIAALVARPETEVAWLADVSIGLRADGLGAVFAVLVAAVSLLVFVYADRYLEADEGRWRFFALCSLFLGAMLALVLASDFLLLLVGWEVIGFCSWALIGYSYDHEAPPPAAARAFLVTRTADAGLYVAAMAAFAAGSTFAFASLGGSDLVAAGAIVAAAGKSAQLPFSSWLFSAMEGPVPVSALLHSATLVAAGAYLLLRLEPVLAATGWALPAVAWLGVATAVVAGLVALVQDDLKRLLAASTSAQYGLVLLGIGSGSIAAGAALLVNHAAYKALLFLAVGLLVIRFGTQSLSRLGGAAAVAPTTLLLLMVAAASLAGLPPLGGFFAKDDVLAAALHESSALYLLGLVAGGLSAVYAFRAVVVLRSGGRARRPRERPAPLLPLAGLGAAVVALAVISLPPVRASWKELLGSEPTAFPALWELLLSGFLALAAGAAGVALARRADVVASPRLAPLRAWLYLDRVHDALALRPALALATRIAAADDRIIDAGVRASARAGNALGGLTNVADLQFWDRLVHTVSSYVRSGGAVRRLQTGALHRYYAFALAGVALVVVAFLSLP